MLSWFRELFSEFASWLLSVLPHSPFSDFIDVLSDIPYLGYLNWFIPVESILTVFSIYLGAVASFYIYSIIARWVKMIGD